MVLYENNEHVQLSYMLKNVVFQPAIKMHLNICFRYRNRSAIAYGKFNSFLSIHTILFFTLIFYGTLYEYKFTYKSILSQLKGI